MDFSSALSLKTAISADFMRKSAFPAVEIFAMSAWAVPNRTAHAVLKEVNGVGVGEKPAGGNVVRVLTRSKTQVSPKILADYYGIHQDEIDIQPTGPITFMLPQNIHRPPYPGVSVGHYQITAGTLGCFVEDYKKRVYILSNNHVLANSGKGYYKDPILQPGKLDGGRRIKRDIIAFLSEVMELQRSVPNPMDAAIAEVESALIPDYKVNGQRAVTGIRTPANGLAVEKFGRTTGHTKGSITTRNMDLSVDFDGESIEFEDQFEIKALRKPGKKRPMFCDGGDSGSLIMETDTGNAVGLLFAGNIDGTTFATPIQDVLDAFAVRIL